MTIGSAEVNGKILQYIYTTLRAHELSMYG